MYYMIIIFILYRSMSWCWQNWMECSLFLPSPGTARADNSCSRHFLFFIWHFFSTYAIYVLLQVLSTYFSSHTFFLQFPSKIGWKYLTFVMFMSLNFPPPLKVKNVCACVVINVILKEKSDYFCHSGHSDLGQKGVFRGAIFPPYTQKKGDKFYPFST